MPSWLEFRPGIYRFYSVFQRYLHQEGPIPMLGPPDLKDDSPATEVDSGLLVKGSMKTRYFGFATFATAVQSAVHSEADRLLLMIQTPFAIVGA